jgi:hypothetical protein
MMAENGVRLDAATIERLATENSRRGWWRTAALWIAAVSLAVLAFSRF